MLDAVTLDQLRTFIAAAEQGSFSAADESDRTPMHAQADVEDGEARRGKPIANQRSIELVVTRNRKLRTK